MNKSPSASPKFSGNRVSKLYIAGDDCPPATEGQKILYIRKGQVCVCVCVLACVQSYY